MENVTTCVIFDPWTATVAQALKWAEDKEQTATAPLAQRHAAHEVLQNREACLAADGGCMVLECLRLCGANQLTPPGWLWDAFIQRHSQVTDAEVGTWDEAFGRPWPAHTRLKAVRERRRLKSKVHLAAWQLAVQEPGLAVNRDFFERISEMPGIPKSGATVERIYYEALADGLTSVALLRKKPCANTQKLLQ